MRYNCAYNIKGFLLLFLLLSVWGKIFSQVDVGVSLGMNFENYDTEGGQEYPLQMKYGNIGVQIGVNSALKLGENLGLQLDLYYVPKKEIPFRVSTFSDNLESYSYQIIKTSLSVGYTIKDLTLGIGGSLSEYLDFKIRWRDEGSILRDNCTMFGGVLTVGYRFKQFYFNGKYRQEVNSRLPFVCAGIRGISTFELNLGYFFTKENNFSRRK